MNMDMANFNEEDFVVDEFDEITTKPQEVKNEEKEVQVDDASQDDLTSEVLRLKGISDPEKIKFEDESGAIVERPWDSLTREEQINILTEQEPVNDLDVSEIELLNSIRTSGMTVADYMNSLKTPIEEPRSYDIDSLTDEDVYALDLLEKVGADNITDEEITQAIENAKLNESLFDKTVKGLRNEYIKLQKDREEQQANMKAAEQEAAYNKFASSINSEIRGLNSFAGNDLELSNEEMEDLSAFILNLDDLGTSAFGRALQDPALFTKAAFWLLNEDKIVEELTKLMLETYKRGYETAKKDLNKSKVVIKPTSKAESASEFVDDEDW